MLRLCRIDVPLVADNSKLKLAQVGKGINEHS